VQLMTERPIYLVSSVADGTVSSLLSAVGVSINT
jgi:hypothetical protein